jgi:hypothetical protein
MAKQKPEYEVVKEFTVMANKIIEKYPEEFYGVEVDKVCCVKVVNKDRGEKQTQLWKTEAVKMPMRIHCPYGWYVTLFSSDWDEMDEKHKYLLTAEILCAFPTDADNEGKVNAFDSKGYKLMQRTFKTIDYLCESNVPHLINDDIEWVKRG